MRWEAHTAFAEIGEGTVFNILATPQLEGEPPDVLTGGVDLWIIKNTGPQLHSKVITASRNEAVIEFNGVQFRMTPVGPEEIGSHITTPGMHSKDWKIRERTAK